MRRDLVCALVLLGIAAGYFGLARNINRSALADEVGAHGLPYAYAALLALLALGLAATRLLRRGSAVAPAASADASSLATLGRTAGAVGIGALYLVLMPLVGYLVATALLLTAMLRYLGQPLGWRPLAIAAGGTLFLWLLFDRVLGIGLPGPLGL